MIKYWVIVSLPLVYFVSQFQGLFFNLFTPLRLSDPVSFGIIYTVVFSATKPVGGVLFGIAFWSVARSINNKPVRDYMIISAIGMMMLFHSNQVSALVAPSLSPIRTCNHIISSLCPPI